MALATITACVLIPLLSQPFWRDEGSTFLDVNQPDVAHVLASMRNYELTPPLYFLIEHFWIRAAGTSEAAMRIPSVLALSVAIALLYDTARTVRDRVAGYATAACAMLAPISLFIGSEARAYAATMLFGALVLRLVAAVLCTRANGYLAAGALGAAIAAYCWTHYTAWTAVAGVIVVTPVLALAGDWKRASIVFAAVCAGAMTTIPLLSPFAHAAAGLPSRFDGARANLFERIANRLTWFSPVLVVPPIFPAFLGIGTASWLYQLCRGARRPLLSPEDQFLVVCLGMLGVGVGSSALRSVASGHHLAAYAPAAWLILGSYYSRIVTWLGLSGGLQSTSAVQKISAAGIAALSILALCSFPVAYAYELMPRSGIRALVQELDRLGARSVTLIAMPDAVSPSLYYYLRTRRDVQLRGIATWLRPWYATATWDDPSLEQHLLGTIDKEAGDGRNLAFAVDWGAQNLNGTRYDVGLDVVRTECRRRGVAISRTFRGTVESADLVLLMEGDHQHSNGGAQRDSEPCGASGSSSRRKSHSL